MSAKYLDGKVAIVTGVSSGLGWGTTKALASVGAKVVGLARRTERGAELSREIKKAGDAFRFIQCDLSNVSDCERAVSETVEAYGRVDILINNAGTHSDEMLPVEKVDEAEWNRVLDINLRAPFTMCRLVLPVMQAQRSGVILNIASINAKIGIANMAAYNASKAGLVHLTNTIAVENADNNVRANAIILGGVPSEMNAQTSAAMGRSLHGADWEPEPKFVEERPSGMMDAFSAGRALAALCMDDASLYTGATIALDGAMTAGKSASTFIYMGSAGLLG